MPMTYTELIRAMVRPVLTLAGWTVLLTMLYEGRPIPDEAFKLIAGLTVWWFVDRSVSHLRDGGK